MFVKIDHFLINKNRIDCLNVSVSGVGTITAVVEFNDDNTGRFKKIFHDQEAIDIVMRLGPQLFEGNPRFKFARHQWAFHNLIAHPLMQILAFFGLTKLGLRVHDATIPRPKVD